MFAEGAGGLTNQRLSFLSGIVAAATLQQLTLVLPSWHERKFAMAGTMASEGIIYPFQHFYKTQPFMELAHRHNFSIVSLLPATKSQACIAQLSAIDDATITNAITTKWASDFGVICMTPGNMFFHADVLWGDKQPPPGLWDEMSAAFQPADQFQSLLNEVVKLVPLFVTVHVRVEEDMQKHCNDNHGSGGQPFHDGRLCALTQQHYLDFLKKAGVDTETRLFIASGTPFTELTTLCADFECFDQSTFEFVEAMSFSYMETAYFDFLLAMQGTSFYGSLSSTFSMQLHGMFKQDHKPADYVNPYCLDGNMHCG